MVKVHDILKIVFSALIFQDAVEHFQVGNGTFEALIPTSEDCPFWEFLNLVDGAIGEESEQFLKLFFGGVVDEFGLEEVLEFFFVGVFDEFVEFLFVDVEYYFFELVFFDSIFEGEEESDCFVEVALQEDLLEELDLFAIIHQTDLYCRNNTPDSLSRARKDSMQSFSFRYFCITWEIPKLFGCFDPSQFKTIIINPNTQNK